MGVVGSGRGGGKSGAEMQTEHQAHMDAAKTTTRCAFCKWTYTGRADEGRELAKGHRRVHHPDIKPVRRKRGSLNRFQGKQPEFRDEGLARAAEVAALHKRRDEEAA